ncbi:MAG: hypothetical protein HOV80_27185 [Polyangiaceae bacterium]|nr:hypothetical protein [Polyangiaceae bacterium]
MRYFLTLAFLGGLAAAAACSEDPSKEEEETEEEEEVTCESSDDCADLPDTPYCDQVCSKLPQGWQLGIEGGEAPTITQIFAPEDALKSTDLEFNPSVPGELWIVNALNDSVYIVHNAGEADTTSEYKRDPAASHFMDRPPALAFGEVVDPWGQTFGICGDSDNGGNFFMGPALFSADPSIFAVATDGGLGSHLDMLHSTSFCRGIAHLENNQYFAFNSQKGSLDKYDFVIDHGPGNDDHSDGEIWRYAAGQVAGVDGIPSHLAYDAESKLLYVADTGNQRIAVLDTASGSMGSTFGGDEPVDRTNVDGSTLTELVPAGTLQAPSGIEVSDGVIFVSDNATSVIHAFDTTGAPIRTLETGLAAGSLAGINFGPDGKLYFVDMQTSAVYRIDPVL